jgi:hypothetical protein
MNKNMNKTKKKSHNSANATRKSYCHGLPQNAMTFHGLECFHKKLYSKMGWMVLSKAKGMSWKVSAYKQSISQLVNSIEHVSQEYRDQDKLHDMNVLHMSAKCLQEFVQKHL